MLPFKSHTGLRAGIPQNDKKGGKRIAWRKEIRHKGFLMPKFEAAVKYLL